MVNSLATFFTKGWTYSIESWAEHVASAISGENEMHIILSTDDSDECLSLVEKLKRKFSCHKVYNTQVIGVDDSQKAYKEEAQKIIARLQQSAFSKAREIGATELWSIESDVLVPPNSLRVLRQALQFDDNYYSVAMVTYPNGQFLGGRGSQTHPIAEDFLASERNIPKELKRKILQRDIRMKELLKGRREPSESEKAEWGEIEKKIKECPPNGNIFELQAKGWRKRGWMESAYPAIGRGAILPTDWVGLGCTIMNKKALSLATFEGYDLKGTQDLFLCWNRWHQHGLKMCVIPHILCSHVKRKVGDDGVRTNEIEVHEAYHELDGELAGHLRWRPKKYYNFNS